MPATSVREPETSSEEHDALEQFAWQTLQGAQNLRRWIWTMILVALALLIIAFFPHPT
jgi:hypothetical protein